MMLVCRLSHMEFQIEVNLGVTKYQVKSYKMALLRVQWMTTLSLGMKSHMTQHFYINWGQMLDLI